jgi:hypothetical protein
VVARCDRLRKADSKNPAARHRRQRDADEARPIEIESRTRAAEDSEDWRNSPENLWYLVTAKIPVLIEGNMTDNKDQGTTAANQRGPTAEPGETGISSNVLRELPTKAHPSIVARIRDHLEKKSGWSRMQSVDERCAMDSPRGQTALQPLAVVNFENGYAGLVNIFREHAFKQKIAISDDSVAAISGLPVAYVAKLLQPARRCAGSEW